MLFMLSLRFGKRTIHGVDEGSAASVWLFHGGESYNIALFAD